MRTFHCEHKFQNGKDEDHKRQALGHGKMSGIASPLPRCSYALQKGKQNNPARPRAQDPDKMGTGSPKMRCIDMFLNRSQPEEGMANTCLANRVGQ